MAGYYEHNRAYAYEGVDEHPEYAAAGQDDENGALFYFMATACMGDFACPPYITSTPLNCVVCTK